MSLDRLIVIGASSGGIDALRHLISGLPASLPAAVCVVSHTGRDSPAVLGDILARAGSLPAALARTGDRLQHGHVYVAPPNHHLLIEPGVLCLSRGPRENRFRPAIDPLFRSAAQVYGPRVIGVVLTGSLDDGAAGLWAIRQLGGTAVVQDPTDASFPAMPTNALRRVPDAHVVPIADMAVLLERLLATSVHDLPHPGAPVHLEVEVRIAKDEPPLPAGVLGLGAPSGFTCPECHGSLLAVSEAEVVRYRCHTGHAYAAESLTGAVWASIDQALGSAERVLQEGEMLARRRADDLDPDLDGPRIATLRAQAQAARRQADVVRRLLSERAALAAGRGVSEEP